VPDPVNHFVPVPSPNANAATKTATHTTDAAPPAAALAQKEHKLINESFLAKMGHGMSEAFHYMFGGHS